MCFHHTVQYDSAKGTAVCSCKKFEFVGIFCSHILKVISSKNITKISSKYILKRWTKDAKKGLAIANHDNVEVDEDQKRQIWLDVTESYAGYKLK